MDDGEGTQSGNGEAQSGATDTTGTSDGNTGTNPEGASGTTETTVNTEAQRAKAEADSLRERMKAADARAAKFEQELRQLRDKDLPEADKMKRDLEDAQATVSKLTERNQQLALQVAFLQDNSVAWHNPERAMKLVDLSAVRIEEDGSVHGMKEALTALAKTDPYLVKTDKPTEVKPPATSPANNGSSGGSGKPKEGAMASRLPVMRTRIRAQ